MLFGIEISFFLAFSNNSFFMTHLLNVSYFGAFEMNNIKAATITKTPGATID